MLSTLKLFAILFTIMFVAYAALLVALLMPAVLAFVPPIVAFSWGYLPSWEKLTAGL